MYVSKIASVAFLSALSIFSVCRNWRFALAFSGDDGLSYRSLKKSSLKKRKVEKNPRDKDNFGFLKGLVRVNLYGNLSEYAYYFAYIGIGNPKAKQMVIVDTGSQLVNVACGNCHSCGRHLLEKYHFNESMTHRDFDCKDEKCRMIGGKCTSDGYCQFTESYSEGSRVKGRYVGDLITFDTTKNTSAVSTFFDYIGCITEETDLIKSQITNGILGLSKSHRPRLINNEYYETQSFIEKYLTDHFKPSKKVFSLCLSDNGGVLVLGGHDKDLDLVVNNVSTIVWEPFMKTQLYAIKVYRMKFKDTEINYDDKKFVLDTGTTISTFEPQIFGELYKNFKDICHENTRLQTAKRAVGQCKVDEKTRQICFSDISKLPPIVLIFENGSKFEWTAESYMINRTKKKTVNDYDWWCVGIEESKTRENILGATFFKNNHLIFDLHRDKIGISVGNCPENKH